MQGEPAFLKTRRIYYHVDEARELSKKTARRWLDGHISPMVRIVPPSPLSKPWPGSQLRWGLDDLDYFGDAEVSSGIEEDSFEVITDGEVDVCFDGWYNDRQVEAGEQRDGGLSQVLLDIVSLAACTTIEDFSIFFCQSRTLFLSY